MCQIIAKINTLDWSIMHQQSHKFVNAGRMKKFIDETELTSDQYTDVKLPDGRPFTKKDLVNYEDYI